MGMFDNDCLSMIASKEVWAIGAARSVGCDAVWACAYTKPSVDSCTASNWVVVVGSCVGTACRVWCELTRNLGGVSCTGVLNTQANPSACVVGASHRNTTGVCAVGVFVVAVVGAIPDVEVSRIATLNTIEGRVGSAVSCHRCVVITVHTLVPQHHAQIFSRAGCVGYGCIYEILPTIVKRTLEAHVWYRKGR